MTKKDKEIKRLNSSKKVNMGEIYISGNVQGSNIVTGSVNASNIAGGDTNVYIVSRHDISLVKFMKDYLDGENLSSENKNYILSAIQDIQEQVELGDKADDGKLNFLLHSIRKISPSTLETLVKQILSQYQK